MKIAAMVLVMLLAGGLPARSQTNVVLGSFENPGRITFERVPNAASYWVEWAPGASGPWTNTWNSLTNFPGSGSGTITASVPMLYRVVATVTNPPSTRPRGAYYVNFQNPAGQPPSPVIVDGKTYLQVGWTLYQPSIFPYYGWVNSTNVAQQMYGYYNGSGSYSIVERSYIFDDYGRQNFFEFELDPGRYLVTVGVGRPGTGSGDPHNLVVEGQVLVNDEVLTDIEARAVEIQLIDGRLSLAVGGMSESTGNWAYTFVSYIKIEPVD